MKKTILALGAIVMMAACTQNKNPFLQEWDTPYGLSLIHI